jgi:hypothetical protein
MFVYLLIFRVTLLQIVYLTIKRKKSARPAFLPGWFKIETVEQSCVEIKQTKKYLKKFILQNT